MKRRTRVLTIGAGVLMLAIHAAMQASQSPGFVLAPGHGERLTHCPQPLQLSLRIDSERAPSTGLMAGVGTLRGDEGWIAKDDTDEVIYVLSGAAHAILDADTVVLEPGDLLFLPPGRPRRLSSRGREPLEYLFVTSPQVSGEAFRRAAQVPCDRTKPRVEVAPPAPNALPPRIVRKHEGEALDHCGSPLRLTLKIDAESTVGTQIRASTWHLGKGSEQSTNTAADEVVFVTRGEGTALIGDNGRYAVKAGSTVFVPRGTSRGFVNASETPLEYVVFHAPETSSAALRHRAVASCQTPAKAQRETPVADHHQHLVSPTIAQMVLGGTKGLPAAELIPLLDAAGIQKAAVLSVAYMFGSPARTVEDEYAKVRAENDWTAAQAAQYPERLIAFCGVNPLKAYALDEIARCAKSPGLRHGLKLHIGNGDIRLENPEHVEQLRKVFRAVNTHRMALVLHLRANIDNTRPYGVEQARLFLEELLPLVPDVPVQVAHMAGTGPGYADPPAHVVMGYLAEAVARGDPRTRNLWFDATSSANEAISAEHAALLVTHIRQVGVDRILYGTDAPIRPNLSPKASWAAFRRLPLTAEEFARIASNVAPYLVPRRQPRTPVTAGGMDDRRR